ncbi:MAG: hypothetical protein AAGG48_10020 [Planctomycetota bacterium]
MNDPEYEVHPLDRDYSQPDPPRKRLPSLPEEPFLRAGIVVFLLGLGSLIVTAMVLGNFTGSGAVEQIGSIAHRIGMLMILGGGVLILAGMRVKADDAANKKKKRTPPFRPRVPSDNERSSLEDWP